MEYERSSSREPKIMHSGQVDEPTVSGLEGSYRVIRLLGRGTMSSVYLAEQVSMARRVALKILSPDLSANPAFVERFLREARASARLNHPNIVSAIDFGEFESRFFLAMEFVDGEALSTLIERDGTLEEKRVISIGLQVISALEHALEHNVIHLDVKPANIMICEDGGAKLADFGLAMMLDNPAESDSSRRAVGTPYYMAPEQVEGGKLDWRADQFALGASLYEAVTGTKPYQGNSVSDILVKRFFEKPIPAWKAGRHRTSRAFSAVLGKMMSRHLEGRYQSFADLKTDFERVKVGKKPAIAKMASTSTMTTPHSSAWNTFGDTTVISRVDGMQWRKRWSWFIYSSLLFIGTLCVYGSMHAKELLGPTPPRMMNNQLLAEAENPPRDMGRQAREVWTGAMRLMMRAETEPTEENILRAIYSFRLLTTNREYTDTVYAAPARNNIEHLTDELHRIGGEFPGDARILKEE